MTPSTDPVPVVVHRPYRTFGESAGRLIAQVGGVFLTAWLVMLALGSLHHHDLPWVPAIGYWQTVLVIYVIRAVFPSFTGINAFADSVKRKAGA